MNFLHIYEMISTKQLGYSVKPITFTSIHQLRVNVTNIICRLMKFKSWRTLTVNVFNVFKNLMYRCEVLQVRNNQPGTTIDLPPLNNQVQLSCTCFSKYTLKHTSRCAYRVIYVFVTRNRWSAERSTMSIEEYNWCAQESSLLKDREPKCMSKLWRMCVIKMPPGHYGNVTRAFRWHFQQVGEQTYIYRLLIYFKNVFYHASGHNCHTEVTEVP